MKVRVDLDKCIAAGQCVVRAPGVFDQREDDGVVVVLTDTPGPDVRQAVQEAAIACPAGVIHLAES